METLLKVENLNVSYGDTQVLRDISFEIKDVIRNGHITGQIVGIVGESGCGKSTLFKVLSGLAFDDDNKTIMNVDGKIEIAKIKGDKIDSYIQPKSGEVGLVDQAYTMFRHRKIRSSLTFALRNRTDVKDIDTHINKYAKEIGIEHVLDKYPNELSGGQRQRAALLERLFNDNHFLILDEPFSGLDVKSKVSAKNFIRGIVNQHEFNTVVFCEHNIEAVVEMSDLIIILSSDGRLVKSINLRDEGYEYGVLTTRHLELVKQIKNTLQLT